MKVHPKQEDVKRIEQETYKLLEDIGLPFKKVSRYEWVNEEGTAVWIGESEETGFVKIYLGCDSEAVAHEIGHGFHEALNRNKKIELSDPFRYPQDGEAVAEAIRFFVEQCRGTSWIPTKDRQTLEKCDFNLKKFKAEVRALFPFPIKRRPDKAARQFFLNELRLARSQAQKNAEDFTDLLVAFERLGSFLATFHDGAVTKRNLGLGSYQDALQELAKSSSLGGEVLEEGSRRWHSTFGCLFDLVKDARNSALHEGAKARHLTEHAIELGLILEEALFRMEKLNEKLIRTVGDLMVRSVITAEEWQPVSFIRQAMLTNSFSYLPIFTEEQWKLLPDHFVVYYLNKAKNADERRVRMATSMANAIADCRGMKLPLAKTANETDSIDVLLGTEDKDGVCADDHAGRLSIPVVVLQPNHTGKMCPKELLVGIISAFDLL